MVNLIQEKKEGKIKHYYDYLILKHRIQLPTGILKYQKFESGFDKYPFD